MLGCFRSGASEDMSALTRTSQPCEVSAPGKVLIVGGYLVLEQTFPGLVLAASARFFSGAWWQVESASESKFRDASVAALLGQAYSDLPLNDTEDKESLLEVCVVSPQFHSTMNFQMCCAAPFTVSPKPGTAPNDFIQRGIACSLLAAFGCLPPKKLSSILSAAVSAGAVLTVSLQADNDFYSQLPHLEAQGVSPSLPALHALPKCLPMLKDAHGKLLLSKTGMGSSAALTSSLTGALLQLLGVTALHTDPGAHRTGMVLQMAPSRSCMPAKGTMVPCASASGSVLSASNSVRVCHQVAQVAHCLAQGKVGSGFDVASACFGSVAYQRVGSDALGRIMATVASVLDAVETVPTGTALQAARSMVSAAEWDYDLAPFSLPPGVDLCLADVCGGSETPSMVRKVLAWLKTTPGARAHWELLGATNAAAGRIMQDLKALHAADEAAYMDAVDALCALPAAQWPRGEGGASASSAQQQWADELLASAKTMFEPDSEELASACAVHGAAYACGAADAAAHLVLLSDTMRMCRVLLRSMGNAAGVPIEPDSQSALLDSTMAWNGVLAAGVPGAGGYDAVFALTLQGRSYDGKAAVATSWLGGAGSAASQQALVCPLLLSAEGCAEPVVQHIQELREVNKSAAVSTK